LVNIITRLLRVRILKKSPFLAPEKHDYTVTARFSFTGTGNPYFVHAAAEVGIGLSRFKLAYHFA
jgi:hypothetical protein